MVMMCLIIVPSNGVLTVIATATAVTSSQSTVNDNSEHHMMSHDISEYAVYVKRIEGNSVSIHYCDS